mmetsp:Transcript_10031/g.23104  ORF Transcript_10031/g.23104 Transcript_10031/m.23104 type:complete len:207 (-) Transcript_10031:548-1168(-)
MPSLASLPPRPSLGSSVPSARAASSSSSRARTRSSSASLTILNPAVSSNLADLPALSLRRSLSFSARSSSKRARWRLRAPSSDARTPWKRSLSAFKSSSKRSAHKRWREARSDWSLFISRAEPPPEVGFTSLRIAAAAAAAAAAWATCASIFSRASCVEAATCLSVAACAVATEGETWPSTRVRRPRASDSLSSAARASASCRVRS